MGNNSGKSDGLLLGMLIGGAAVFLLGTEKGNRVLKTILEEGRAGLGDLMDEIEEYKEEINEARELEFVDKEADRVVETAKVPSGSEPASTPKPKSPSKRFFRKTK